MRDGGQERNFGRDDEEIGTTKKWEYEEGAHKFNTRPRKFKTNKDKYEFMKIQWWFLGFFFSVTRAIKYIEIF